MLVIGWDPVFDTWFAMHHDTGNVNKPPRVAIGYHPSEQFILRAERPDAVIGPYPVSDLEGMLTKLIPELMGIEPEPNQRMCYYCGEKPWVYNPDCHAHPYNKLKND